MIVPMLETKGGILLLLCGVITIFLLWWFLQYLESRRQGRLSEFADSDLLERLVTGHAPRLRWPLNALIVAGAFGVLLALAGPRWGEGLAVARRGSREILVILDTSESMNAVNPAPSRLGRAQEKIGELLETCPGDRFALIAFSGAAVLECPFTRDHAYFKTILQSTTTDTLTEEGTNIEAALNEAEKLFEDERTRGNGATLGDRMILLISDGEAPEAGAVAAAERLASASRIAVMGIGDPDGAEVTLPQWMARSNAAPAGPATHWSALNEAALSSIAVAGGGVYVRSTLGGEDLVEIRREMADLEGIAEDNEPGLGRINRYRWPLGAAVVLFAAEAAWLVWLRRGTRWAASRTLPREAADGMD